MSNNIKCTYLIGMIISLLSFFEVYSQKTGAIDTIFRDKNKLLTKQEVDNFYNYPLVGDTYSKHSVFSWNGLQKKWMPVTDTIFGSEGKYRVTVSHSFFNNNQIDLVNSYIRDPWSTKDNRFCFFIVIDKLHIVNSFRIVDDQELPRQYIVAKQYKNLEGGGMEYINLAYDYIKEDSLTDEDYGITLKLDHKTKSLQEVNFSDLFYKTLRPAILGRIETIYILDNGKSIRIE